MILGVKSSFRVGDRVQIVLPKLNLEAGAGNEYPHLGTGTAEVPMLKKKVLEPDLHRQQALQDESQVFVRLDKSFVRERDPKEKSPHRDRVKKREVLREMPVPYGILQALKPENDPFVKQG